jgi:geranylgeranyl pyrophosphate synthase
VWARHGEALARATGDHLFALAFAGLAQAGSPEAVALLAQASLDLARGEALQSEQARRPEITVEAYLERCRFKTGRLFAAACALGGMFGGLERAGIDGLERFGEQLGIAFQLADDLLDCDGDPESTGKALGVDLLDGTVTLPLLLAAQRDESVAAALVDRERAAADVIGILARVAATGAIADTRRAVLEHAEAARAALSALPERSDRRALEAIVQAATTRDH